MAEPDIKLSKAEMRMGLKVRRVPGRVRARVSDGGLRTQNAPTACLKIDSDLLEPAKCYSKAGAR